MNKEQFVEEGNKFFHSEDWKAIKGNYGNYVTDFWKNINDELSSDFEVYFDGEFLKNQLIRNTMYFDDMNIGYPEFKEMFTSWPIKWLEDIKETPIGSPNLAGGKIGSSWQSIHHAYSCFLLWQLSKSFKSYSTVVEWGGGYGRFAHIFNTLHSCKQYNIIDLPVFCAIQYLYLKALDWNVKLIKDVNTPLTNVGINVIPVGIAKDITLNSDLFIALWSLSESNQKSVDFAFDSGWFKNDVLIATGINDDPNLPKAKYLVEKLRNDKSFVAIEHPHIPGQMVIGRKS